MNFAFAQSLSSLKQAASLINSQSNDNQEQVESVDFGNTGNFNSMYVPKINSNPIAAVGLDEKIDPENYILGTGDELSITIFGASLDESFRISVDYEGNVIIPTVGEISVDGKSLLSAKLMIQKEISKLYKGKSIAISLSRVKTFKVNIVGNIERTGAYTVWGYNRVSDVVAIANTLSRPLEKTKMRGIHITNKYYGDYYADLSSFYHSNNLKRNPYLRPGDVINVPIVDGIIEIHGAVKYPNKYIYINNDKLSDILSACGGLLQNADSTRIIISRFLNEYDSITNIDISLREVNPDQFEIKIDDRILVKAKPEYRVHRQVKISGEVKYPGVYPIREGISTLKDILNEAGGLTDKAFLKGCKVIRTFSDKTFDREFTRLKALPIETLDPVERSYLKSKQTEVDGKVSVDFYAFSERGDENSSLLLKSDDKIIIPEKSYTIQVSGAVVSPGHVPFVQDKDYGYYINKAGSYNTKAKKRDVMIIKAGTGVWLKPRKVEKLEEGDVIYIPEKQYVDRFIVTKDVLSMVGSIAAVIMAGLAIRTAIDEMK